MDLRMATPKKAQSSSTKRRSPCAVACTLDLLGDKWTMLVVRDLFLGAKRFKDFEKSPEGIPTNILTDRLNRLVAGGVVRKVAAADGSKRLAYTLTEKGLALLPMLRALRDWGLEWLDDTRAMSPEDSPFGK